MAPRNPFVFTRDDYEQHVRTLAVPRVSQRSEYDEVELVEDCTLFDLYRQPRQPVTDPAATRTLLVRVLNAELTCPICLGIIRQTEVVMECLHRFCGDCIQRSLRVGKNECPSCRIHIPSKRSLRRDTNFDALIAKIYPNLDEFNEQEEKLIEELNRERHFHNARTTSTKMGVQNQQTLRRNVSLFLSRRLCRGWGFSYSLSVLLCGVERQEEALDRHRWRNIAVGRGGVIDVKWPQWRQAHTVLGRYCTSVQHRHERIHCTQEATHRGRDD
jgi:hypothetical protein